MPTRNEINQRLNSLGALKPCEACGNKTWISPTVTPEKPENHLAMWAPPDPGAATVLSMLVGTGGGSLVVRFTPLICSNCGNTRLFHLGHLEKEAGRE